MLKQLLGNSNNDDLKTKLKEKPFLVDVRSVAEFKSGSVKNAINIPLDQIEAKLETFKNKSNIVVFCRSGNRSGMAKSILNKKGINNVLNGGSWNNVAQLLK
jgi:phage shock protein E